MFITMGDRLKLNRETGIQYVVFDQSNETQAQSIEVIGLRGSNSGPTLKEAIVASSPAGERQPAQVPALSPPADVEQPMRIDDVRAHWMVMICMRERIDFVICKRERCFVFKIPLSDANEGSENQVLSRKTPRQRRNRPIARPS